MGERFLKLRLSRPPREASRKRAARSLENLGLKKSRSEGLQRVVAGYLKKKLPKSLPRFTRESTSRIIDAAELVASVRAQVERDMRRDDPLYKPEPEGLDRVTKQLGAVAAVLSWMLGLPEVGGQAMRIAEKVAVDTICGFDSDIVDAVMQAGGSATRKDIAITCSMPSSTVARRIEDMLLTGVLILEESADSGTGGRPPNVYSVRGDVAALWNRVRESIEESKKGESPWQKYRQRSRTGRSGSARSLSSSGGSNAMSPVGSAKSVRRSVMRSAGAQMRRSPELFTA